jgi:hypothetical protein
VEMMADVVGSIVGRCILGPLNNERATKSLDIGKKGF